MKKNRLLSEKVKRFFFKSYYVKIYFMEEWLSSNEAFALLRESGYSLEELKKNPGLVDKASAARILQSFLNTPPAQRVQI